jgi:hypothetical protein
MLRRAYVPCLQQAGADWLRMTRTSEAIQTWEKKLALVGAYGLLCWREALCGAALARFEDHVNAVTRP